MQIHISVKSNISHAKINRNQGNHPQISRLNVIDN